VLRGSIDAVLSSGAYGTAAALLDPAEDGEPDAVTLVIQSREAMQRGDTEAAVELATRATEAAPGASFAAITSMTAKLAAGQFETALEMAQRLDLPHVEPTVRALGRAMISTLSSSLDGDLREAVRALEAVIALASRESERHYRGVAELDLASIYKAMGRAEDALRAGEEAISALDAGSGKMELVSARLVRSWALAHLGRLSEARDESAIARSTGLRTLEASIESAEVEINYGDPELARRLLGTVDDHDETDADLEEQRRMALIQLAVIDGAIDLATSYIRGLRFGQVGSAAALESKRMFLTAQVAVVTDSAAGLELLARAERHATAQSADYWVLSARLLRASAGGALDWDRGVAGVAVVDRAFLSIYAEAVVTRLADLSDAALATVSEEVTGRPERWRPALRRAVDSGLENRRHAATLLEAIGTEADIHRLRDASRALRGSSGSPLGRRLIRRLAPRAWIEDLGRVEIRLGEEVIDGSRIRRKVLALLCLLLTRPRFSASREEVLERLWPDLDPETALNSLNQTVYFLRRVFEPAYKEDVSPGYVAQDTETVWLDSELLNSRSNTCQMLIRSLGAMPTPDEVLDLARQYRGRFALDFAYDEWASVFRDGLHASYLRVVETSLRAEISTGNYTRGILLAERALETDPESDDLQASLVRLYRIAGVHAAAAERYSHYADTLRDLGVEPPQLQDV
jgi:DNA-binding SARP family transcriptional activator